MGGVDTPEEWLAVLSILGLFGGILLFIIDARISKVLNELKPNHGSSLRDAIDRIERKYDDHIQWHLENKSE